MWHDSDETKRIAQLLNLKEVGANNGWMGAADVDYEYYQQCLERDPKIIARLASLGDPIVQ